CDTTKTTSGASCASSTGAASVPRGERWNATSVRSGTGRSTAGRRLKKSAPRGANHRLHRRERIERTPASGADLGAARADSGPAISLQLESAVGCRRDHLVELLLPAYAPELNPVEYIWGYWKHHELPNFCPRDFVHLSYQARRALRRMRRRPPLVRSFWRQAQMSL